MNKVNKNINWSVEAPEWAQNINSILIKDLESYKNRVEAILNQSEKVNESVDAGEVLANAQAILDHAKMEKELGSMFNNRLNAANLSEEIQRGPGTIELNQFANNPKYAPKWKIKLAA